MGKIKSIKGKRKRKSSILMDAEEKPDPVGELGGFHIGWTPGEPLFRVNGLDIISFIPEHWKPGTNVLTHHKGKISDTHNLFVPHCKTFPNPLNFVMILGANPLKTFPQEASSFYAVITQWCHGPSLGGLSWWRERWPACQPKENADSPNNPWEEWRDIWPHFNLFLLTRVLYHHHILPL